MQSNPHWIDHLGLARQTYFLRNTIQLFYNDLGPRSHQIHSKSHGKIYPIKCLFEDFFSWNQFLFKPLLFFLNKRNNVIFGNTWLHHDKIFNIFVEKPSFSSNIYFPNNFQEITCKFTSNLHIIKSVSLHQTYTEKCKFTLVSVSLV